eukprot:TRINITY_DN258_c0_g3_i1.p1 TRINITY_DN258_c0_g3~~TRINITY_DN258_c0_g3_i1.p1  ORF type:complete len:414 (+),score=85.54 TRINITY_DN258_c0_g3_i1:23-1243(+)
MSLARCWGRVTNLTITRGKGCTVWDTNGKAYIDCAAGIATVNTGHCHPKVVSAIKEQSNKIIHCQVNCHYSDTLTSYAARLSKHTGNLDNFFFSNSGAEAIEGTAKLMRAYTKKLNILAVFGGFHGRTATAMTLTASGSRYRSPYFPAQPNIIHTTVPLCEEEVDDAINHLNTITTSVASWDSIAGVIIEPILGEGGYHKVPTRFLKYLSDKCTENDSLLCFDEIQSGFGRTGKMFAYEHTGVSPDILTFGKGIAGGMPFAGFSSTKQVMNSLEPGMHGGTYGGNPVAAAAAHGVLDVMEDPAFFEAVRSRGAQLSKGLSDIKSQYPTLLTDIRCNGMMIAWDMPTTALCTELSSRMLTEHNIILFAPCGSEKRTMRFMPPLVMSESVADVVLAALDKALKSMSSS